MLNLKITKPPFKILRFKYKTHSSYYVELKGALRLFIDHLTQLNNIVANHKVLLIFHYFYYFLYVTNVQT